jgi:hypothetical protein
LVLGSELFEPSLKGRSKSLLPIIGHDWRHGWRRIWLSADAPVQEMDGNAKKTIKIDAVINQKGVKS